MWDIQSIIAIDSALDTIEKRKKIPKEIRSSYRYVLEDVRANRIQGKEFRKHIQKLALYVSAN